MFTKGRSVTTWALESVPVLALKFELPLYTAVIVCVPAVSAAVENAAVPFASRGTAGPMSTPLSRNCIVPVAAVVFSGGVTVAVNVTFWVSFAPINDDDTDVAGVALSIMNVCCEVAGLWLASPLCEAVTVQVPAPVR